MKAFIALIRHQWMETRLFLAIAMAIVLLPAAFIYTMTIIFEDPAYHSYILSDLGDILISSLTFALMFLIPTTCFSHCGRDDVSPHLPRRVYTLPVSTAMLVTAYLGYRVFLVALFTEPVVIVAMLLDPYYEETGVLLATVAIMFPLAQSLLWLLRGRHWLWLAAAVIAIAGFMQFFAPTAFGDFFLGSGATPALVLLALTILLPIPLAYWGISRDRRGSGQAAANSVTSTRFRARGETFASPAQAQRWFELRSKGFMLPICVMVLVCLFALVAMADEYLSLNPWSLWAILLGAAALTGALLPVYEHRLRRGGASSFVWTHPINTRALTRERLKAMALTLAWCSGLIFLMTLVTPYGARAHDSDGASSLIQEVFGALLIADNYLVVVVFAAIFAWSALTWAYGWVALYVLYGMTMFVADEYDLHRALVRAMGSKQYDGSPFLLVGLALLVILTVWAALRSTKLGLLGIREGSVIAVTTLAGLSSTMAIHWIPSENHWPTILMACTTLFAVAPFCVMPLLHHRARHR